MGLPRLRKTLYAYSPLSDVVVFTSMIAADVVFYSPLMVIAVVSSEVSLLEGD